MKNRDTAAALIALTMLVLAAWPVQAEEGMTGLPVVPLGSIAPKETPNMPQLLAMNVTGVNLSTANNTTQEILVISSYGGNVNAMRLFRDFGERNMDRAFGPGTPSDRSVMETPTQAGRRVY